MSLSGSPAYTTQSPTVGFNWTDTPLAPGVNADFFSARWTSSQPLNPGHYMISTRADDGVRVWVAGTLLIDRFAVSTGQTYTTTFYTGGGQVPIVEYYEGTGVAFLSFVLEAIAPPTPTPAPRRRRHAHRAVLRAECVQRAGRGDWRGHHADRPRQTYPITGRNADSSWWQIPIPAFACPASRL